MNKELKKQLDLLSEVDFRELDISLEMAKGAKSLIKDFSLRPEYFCEKMNLPAGKLVSYLSGSYPYHIRDMASQQALYMELMAEKDARQREKEAEMSFVDAKTQPPPQ